MEEAAIAKIASEALKPVSGLIDALLSPRLERIKNWAEKQELTNRLESMVIDKLLDQYLRHLLRRVCGITTIVFPQQVLPLTDIYEPLRVKGKYRSARTKEVNELRSTMLKPGRNYLIIDSAGMGKSTFAKHLVLEILNITIKFPIFLELRRINESETLLERLCKEFDEAQNEINEKLLLMLLDQGNYVIILDGYDELSDHLRDEIGSQITELAIRCDKNSFILTSRPEVSLPEIPNSNIFEIEHLIRDQAESLVLRYDKVANLDVGKRLIEQFDNVSGQFLETPLLVALLYRTFGFNQSIATRISSFYDDIFNAFYKGHDLSKSGFARTKSSQLDAEDFRRLLRGFSFILAARQKDNLKNMTEGITVINEAIRLTSVSPQSSSAFFDDLLLAVPLLVKDGTDFRFIHKSVGEFFAAEFLAYAPNSEPIIEKIQNGNLHDTFISCFQFLSDINPNLFRRLIAAPLAKEILKEGKPIQDPFIRSLCFTHEVFLSFWPNRPHGLKTRNSLSAMSRSSLIEFSTILNGQLCILALSYREVRKTIPTEAWKLITKEVDPQFVEMFLEPEIIIDGIDDFLAKEQWISIDDEIILNHASHKVIRGLTVLLMSFISSSKSPDSARILDEESCKNLLLQIQQESQTQDWLESLISGE